VAAKQDVSVQSASAHIDWAAAKKITLATAGGARLTLEGGNIVVECPGKITVHAGKKSFAGPQHASVAVQAMPHADIRLDQEFVLYLDNGEPVANRQYEIHFADGAIQRGSTDGAGRTGLKKAAFPDRYRIRVLPPQAS
ncbi:hypothetical protein CKO44_24745, partial [Rubrivivax gelatinosus]|uniref:DUF2345 domain-containing protein n=1 Tax=Rubrivivax gelatinosus TaxID=28068 RepID=UPI001905D985